MKSKIGNGKNTFMWFDNWNPRVPLQPLYGDRTIYDAATNAKTKVAEFLNGNMWRWPSSTTWEINEIKNDTIPSIDTSMKDSLIWLPDASGKYSTSSTLHAISNHLPFKG